MSIYTLFIVYPKLRKLNGKLCTLYVQNVWFAEKLNTQNCVNSTGYCVHFLYGMSRFTKKLNIQNCVNATENCVQYMYGLSEFVEKLNIQKCVNSTRNWVHYRYRMSGFAEKLNIQNSVNSTGNCARYICTKCLLLQRNWISRTA